MQNPKRHLDFSAFCVSHSTRSAVSAIHTLLYVQCVISCSVCVDFVKCEINCFGPVSYPSLCQVLNKIFGPMTYSWLCMYIARSAVRAEIILLFCTVRDQLSCPSDTLIYYSSISAIRAQVI
jgi:hypothetical protein